MGENRYNQFKDKELSRIRVRRGSNQEFEPYMNEKAYPWVHGKITILIDWE